MLAEHRAAWHLPFWHDVKAVLFGEIGDLSTSTLRAVVPLVFEGRVSALLYLLGRHSQGSFAFSGELFLVGHVDHVSLVGHVSRLLQ